MKSKSVRSNLLSAAAKINQRSTLIYLPIDAILTDSENPRRHPRDQVRAIAESMEAFGNNAPLLVDGKNRLVAGHGRLQAAKLLGVTEVPVVRLEHLSDAQAKAYALADNKLCDRSSFDDRLVAVRLKELQAMSLEFRIEATGFPVPEIDFRVQSLEPSEEGDDDDEFEQPVNGSAVSNVGDLWRLGPHRLFNGNALDPIAYDTLLGMEQAGVLLTDPPYNVSIRHVAGNGRKKHREFAMAVGELSQHQFTNFLFSFLHETGNRMESTAVRFLFMDWKHLSEAITAVTRSGCEIINVCVWDKGQGGMGSLYRSAYELVLVFRERGAKTRNNVQLGKFHRNRTNIWRYPGMGSFAGRSRTPAHKEHPCVKPIAMFADAILDVSRPQDIVLDPFTGSGTVILAAERTGRRGYGIELDPIYVDLTIKRWQKMTGEVATHVSGKTFAEIRCERSVDNAE